MALQVVILLLPRCRLFQFRSFNATAVTTPQKPLQIMWHHSSALGATLSDARRIVDYADYASETDNSVFWTQLMAFVLLEILPIDAKLSFPHGASIGESAKILAMIYPICANTHDCKGFVLLLRLLFTICGTDARVVFAIHSLPSAPNRTFQAERGQASNI